MLRRFLFLTAFVFLLSCTDEAEYFGSLRLYESQDLEDLIKELDKRGVAYELQDKNTIVFHAQYREEVSQAADAVLKENHPLGAFYLGDDVVKGKFLRALKNSGIDFSEKKYGDRTMILPETAYINRAREIYKEVVEELNRASE